MKNKKSEQGMYTIVFDTTGKGVILALYQDANLVKKVEKFSEFGQAENLAVEFDEILKQNNLTFGDVDLLGVCCGPGSFTGVRASLAFARGLALCNKDMAITGVSGFEVYANMLDVSKRGVYNAVIIETKREDFYFQLFDKELNKISEPMALSRDEIATILKSHHTSFIGDGVERFLSVSMGLQIKTVELTDNMGFEALFNVVYTKYMQKKLDFPKPLYIRGVETCVK